MTGEEEKEELMNALHRLAELADWNGWPPRTWWAKLLDWCDRRYLSVPWAGFSDANERRTQGQTQKGNEGGKV